MIDTVLTFLITRTSVLRIVAAGVSGALINSGVISKDKEEIVIGAILAIITGLLQLGVSYVRKKGVKETQRVLKSEGLYTGKVDGWHGPQTETAIRRAIPVHGGDPYYK